MKITPLYFPHLRGKACYGNGWYLSNNSQFVFEKASRFDDYWTVSMNSYCINPDTDASTTFLESGIDKARFPTRRAAVHALESIFIVA